MFTSSKVDNPGEVVRITPKKGEVDYPGVHAKHAKHAKARPGFTSKSTLCHEVVCVYEYEGHNQMTPNRSSDITLSSASLSSAADTDDLSSLGVPVSRPK